MNFIKISIVRFQKVGEINLFINKQHKTKNKSFNNNNKNRKKYHIKNKIKHK